MKEKRTTFGPSNKSVQTEKEALDDLSIDLELLDEDKMVLYAVFPLFFFPLNLRSASLI